MDFELQTTKEQERFRSDVREWLTENVPDNLVDHPDPADLTFDEYQSQRELGRKLGKRGWLYPSYPIEYGGAALSFELCMVLEEEMDRYHLAIPPYYDTGGRLGGASIYVWGTEEQKRYFLPKIFGGEIRTWQLLTEPEAGSDLAGVQSTAVRDGEDYIINGQKIFVGSNHGAEYSWMIARTDPDAPRHENLGWFMVPMDTEGIRIDPMDLLFVGGERGAASGVKNTVYFDNVRISSFNLVGGENNGWKVAGTHLEIEHGLLRSAVRTDELWDQILRYCKSTYRRGLPISKDPKAREHLVDIYIDSQVTRLLHFRNYAYRAANRTLTYEGSQAYLYQKRSALRKAQSILKIIGPQTLTTDPDWSVEGGHLEVHQRGSIVDQHPGGTAEIQRVIMARRLGVGRDVKEQPGRIR